VKISTYRPPSTRREKVKDVMLGIGRYFKGVGKRIIKNRKWFAAQIFMFAYSFLQNEMVRQVLHFSWMRNVVDCRHNGYDTRL
jgi:hypothetical protein